MGVGSPGTRVGRGFRAAPPDGALGPRRPDGRVGRPGGRPDSLRTRGRAAIRAPGGRRAAGRGCPPRTDAGAERCGTGCESETDRGRRAGGGERDGSRASGGGPGQAGDEEPTGTGPGVTVTAGPGPDPTTSGRRSALSHAAAAAARPLGTEPLLPPLPRPCRGCPCPARSPRPAHSAPARTPSAGSAHGPSGRRGRGGRGRFRGAAGDGGGGSAGRGRGRNRRGGLRGRGGRRRWRGRRRRDHRAGRTQAGDPVAVGPALGRAAPLADGRAAADAPPVGAALPEAPGPLLAPGLPGSAAEPEAVAPASPGTPGARCSGARGGGVVVGRRGTVHLAGRGPVVGLSGHRYGQPGRAGVAREQRGHDDHGVRPARDAHEDADAAERPAAATGTRRRTPEVGGGLGAVRPSLLSGSSWTVTSPGSAPSPSGPPGFSPQGSRRSLERSFSDTSVESTGAGRRPFSRGTSISERYLPPPPVRGARDCPRSPGALRDPADPAPATGTSRVGNTASGHSGRASRQFFTCALPPTELFRVRLRLRAHVDGTRPPPALAPLLSHCAQIHEPSAGMGPAFALCHLWTQVMPMPMAGFHPSTSRPRGLPTPGIRRVRPGRTASSGETSLFAAPA